MTATFDKVADIIAETSEIDRETITPESHTIDDLGIDYVQRRSALIDAVTIEDAKRVAKRLYGGGLLVTVAGKPKGLTSSGTTE